MKNLLMFALILLLVASSAAQSASQESTPMPQYFYTYHQPTGNKLVAGQGTFPDVDVQDFELTLEPTWILGFTAPDDRFGWLVRNDFGEAQTVSTDPDRQLRTGIAAGLIFTPPVFAFDEAEGQFNALQSVTSRLSHPVPLGDAFLAISTEGDLLRWRNGEVLDRLALAIQPDARIVVNDNGQAAVYANASDQRYVHGIMGDDIEGSSLLVLAITADDQLGLVTRIDLPGDAVYEGLFPIWADVDGDSMADLITTVSDSQNGSRIRVYRFTYDGIRDADGPAIGQPHRWQHQLAFAPFGPEGEMELVDVLTPHIGGIVRFYQFDGQSMQVVERLGGYTSHSIGSRNLDMAVAGDFNGDGQPEIVLPSQDKTRLGAIQHTTDGAQVVWELPLDGQLVTNLAAINLPGGRLALAAGLEDGRLRVWSSR